MVDCKPGPRHHNWRKCISACRHIEKASQRLDLCSRDLAIYSGTNENTVRTDRKWKIQNGGLQISNAYTSVSRNENQARPTARDIGDGQPEQINEANMDCVHAGKSRKQKLAAATHTSVRRHEGQTILMVTHMFPRTGKPMFYVPRKLQYDGLSFADMSLSTK